MYFHNISHAFNLIELLDFGGIYVWGHTIANFKMKNNISMVHIPKTDMPTCNNN